MTESPPFQAPLLASYPALSVPITILVVEDDPSMAILVQRQLVAIQEAFPRCTIEIVHTWEHARSIIYAEPPPSVTLLDLSLPGSEMIETIKRVAEIDERTAVVIITGHGKEDVERLLVNSDVEVLQKSPSLWMPGNIIRAIVRALERKQLADAKGRISKVEGIVAELKRLGYGTQETL